MKIRTVLFDADGVLQRPTVWWREAFEPILGSSDPASLGPFLEDILQAESTALCTPSGFVEALALVLNKWHRPERLADALRALNAIDIYEDVMRVAQSLRRAGIPCHIASNQQASRAHHMSEVLSYKALFGQEFYSCYLGVAKPDIAFFQRVLHALGVRGNNVLFLDDREENVRAARKAGLVGAVYAGDNGASVLQQMLEEYGLRVA
jgi:putative hydrolase of the HAD superfamily